MRGVGWRGDGGAFDYGGDGSGCFMQCIWDITFRSRSPMAAFSEPG